MATKKKAARRKVTKKPRGSKSLTAGLHPTQARQLEDAMKGFKVVNWEIYGKPSPELVRGGISGSPARIGAAITKLLKIKEIGGIEILINGQPRPDLAIARFRMTGR